MTEISAVVLTGIGTINFEPFVGRYQFGIITPRPCLALFILHLIESFYY